jgi:hypothetical protein
MTTTTDNNDSWRSGHESSFCLRGLPAWLAIVKPAYIIRRTRAAVGSRYADD